MSDWRTFLTQYKAPSDVWAAQRQLQSLAPLDPGIAAKVAAYKAPTDQQGAYNARFNQNPYGFTPQEQSTYDAYNNQRNTLTSKLTDFQHQVNPAGSPFTRFMKGLEKLPVVGDVVSGANEVFGRPGDLFNNPAQFIGKAAAGAAPFLGGTIGPWSKIMGFGGKALAGGAFNNPGKLLGYGAMLAAPFVGGDIGKGLSIGGNLYNKATAGGNGMGGFDWGSLLGGAIGAGAQAAGAPSWSMPLINMGTSALTGGGGSARTPTDGYSGFGNGAYGGNMGYGGGGYGNYGSRGNMGGMGGGNMFSSPGQYAPYAAGALGLAGLLGGGSGVNALTEPFGAKLFSGGPYPDAGMGDKALNYSDLLGNAGKGMLTTGTSGLPSLNNMGVLGNMQGVMSAQAKNAGVADPFTGQGGSADPYAIQPYQQQSYNDTANMINQGRTAAISNLRSQMAAQGINDPRAMAAAEAAINAGHNDMITKTHTDLANQAYTNRTNALNTQAQQLPQLYGAQYENQQGNLNNAYRFIGQGTSAYESAADRALRQHLYDQLNQGGMIGNLLGYSNNPMGGMQRPGQLPGAGGTSPGFGQPLQPGQPGYDTGAGNPGGVGPMPENTGNGAYGPWGGQSYAPGADPNDPYGWLTGGGGQGGQSFAPGYDPNDPMGWLTGGGQDYSNLFNSNPDWMNLSNDQLGYYGA